VSIKEELGQSSDSCTFLVPSLPGRAGHKSLGLLPKGWLRGLDLNQRPLGYEPNELPDCSTPHSYDSGSSQN
jgi:hypothetical protein